MLEIGIFVGLLGSMGFYMVKSSDLSKELKDRRQQNQHEYAALERIKNKPFQISLKEVSSSKKKSEIKTISVQKTAAVVNKIEKVNNTEKRLSLNKQIDQLTVEITSLEQEIKANTRKNLEIQSLISSRLDELERLQKELTSLA